MNNNITKINNLYSSKKIFFIFLSFELPILIYLVYYYNPFIIFFPILILSFIVFYFSLINFEFWILSSIILFAPLTAIKTEGISFFEVAIAFYIFIPLGLWFFKKIFVEKTKIIYNKSDTFVFIFYFICIGSVSLTLINNFSLKLWFQEIIVFSCFFLFFPLREYLIIDKKRIIKVLISFGILSLFISFYNLYQYRSKLSLATQFYQVWGSRIGATEQVFMFCVLIIIAIIFLVESSKIKFFLLFLIGLFFTSLVLSFTRSYLSFTILGILYLWFFFEKKDKIKLSLWILLFIIVITLILVLLFDNLSKFILQALVDRFLSAKGKDISIIQRVVETEAILKQIYRSPILGWGLGATFRRYDLFFELHIMSYYAHNGYLYLWYKLGVFGIFSFLYFYFYKLYTLFKSYKIETDKFYRNLILVFIYILISFLFISITSPQFYHKPSILIMSIIWAIGDSILYKKIPLIK